MRRWPILVVALVVVMTASSSVYAQAPSGSSDKMDKDKMMDKMEKDEKKPTFYGSWYFASGHTASGGRIMSTSLSLLCLEVYYRHLPLYRMETGGLKDVD